MPEGLTVKSLELSTEFPRACHLKEERNLSVVFVFADLLQDLSQKFIPS